MMNALVLLAETTDGGQVEQIARTFGVDWQHLIAQIISFSIVCALLYRFAYRPVLTMLEQRRQRIAESLADVERIKAELAQSEAHRREILIQANAQALKLIEEARAAAARVQAEETQKAIASAEQILGKAREATVRDHDLMLAELKHELGRLVVETTSVVTGKILTPEDQHRLAEEAAEQVGAR